MITISTWAPASHRPVAAEGGATNARDNGLLRQCETIKQVMGSCRKLNLDEYWVHLGQIREESQVRGASRPAGAHISKKLWTISR